LYVDIGWREVALELGGALGKGYDDGVYFRKKGGGAGSGL
jgi:hypothetical protein